MDGNATTYGNGYAVTYSNPCTYIYPNGYDWRNNHACPVTTTRKCLFVLRFEGGERHQPRHDVGDSMGDVRAGVA